MLIEQKVNIFIIANSNNDVFIQSTNLSLQYSKYSLKNSEETNKMKAI